MNKVANMKQSAQTYTDLAIEGQAKLTAIYNDTSLTAVERFTKQWAVRAEYEALMAPELLTALGYEGN